MHHELGSSGSQASEHNVAGVLYESQIDVCRAREGGKMYKRMAGKSLLAMTMLLVIALLGGSIAGTASAAASDRQGNHISEVGDIASSNPTAMQLVQAMSTPDFHATVKSAEYEGHPAQKAVLTQSMQGFPLTGSSFTVLSTGIAANAPGTATAFASTDMGGTFKANWGPYGLDAYDLASLSVTVKVPKNASVLTFSYKYGTEENPTYLGSVFKDYLIVMIELPNRWCQLIPLLPDGSHHVYIDNAAEYSNKVKGSSFSPQPPFPEPDDTVYNAVTELQTVQYDVSSVRDQEIVLHIELADVSDPIYDSAVFLDGFDFHVGEVPDDSLGKGKTVYANTLKDPANPPLYRRLPVREAAGTTKKAVDYMQRGNTGTIIGGPVSVPGEKWTWWEVQWDVRDVKGWSAGEFMSLTPPNPEPAAPQPFKIGDDEWDFEKWAEEAVKWGEAKQEEGATWIRANNMTLCMRFVADAFQLSTAGASGYCCAIKGAQTLHRFNQAPQGWKDAPKGAVIFFDRTPSVMYGHVGIYLGGNDIIHVTWPTGKLETDKMSKLPSYVGGYIGWTYPPVASPDWRPDSPPPTEPKAQAVSIESPGQLRVYDAAGRVTGMVDGETRAEIPGSSYDPETNTVTIEPALEDYRIEIHGDDEGIYALRLVRLLGEGHMVLLGIREGRITPGDVHRYYISWADVAEGKKGVTITIDDEAITTSMPKTPGEPFPANEATDVSPETLLSWSGGDHVDAEKDIYYEIYLGTDPFNQELDGVIGPFPATESQITHRPKGNPGQLQYNTTYYWQIVAVDEFGIASQGPMWSFTTITSVETATGSGTAFFTPSDGVIEGLEALPEVPPGAPAGVTFPHGMFSFKVTELDYDGQTVTVTINLPTPVPAGTRWWKYHDGQWHDYGIPITIDGDTITITLTDGGIGDIDGMADGIINDPGGPGVATQPPTAGAAYPVWSILLAAVMAGASLWVLRRRHAQI